MIATGQTHSVKEFLEIAFDHVGLHWQDYVVQDPRFMRPAEVDQLVGDASKARRQLDWEPSVSFEELVRTMVDADLDLLRAGLRNRAYSVVSSSARAGTSVSTDAR